MLIGRHADAGDSDDASSDDEGDGMLGRGAAAASTVSPAASNRIPVLDAGQSRQQRTDSGAQRDPDGTFARPQPGDFAFEGDVAPVPRGHRPGKTHVRARKPGVNGSGGSNSSGVGGGIDGAPAARSASQPAGRAGGGRREGSGAAAAAGGGSLSPQQPAFVPAPDGIVPLQEPGCGRQQPLPQRLQADEADAEGTSAADAAATAPAESQQFADRFGSGDSGGGAPRDVIRDPVAAVRRWQEALFGADLDD